MMFHQIENKEVEIILKNQIQSLELKWKIN